MKLFFAFFRRLNLVLYRVSKGRVMGSFDSMPILLLTTTGVKSGKARTTPLMFIEQDGSYVVVASNAGEDRHPAWYPNLRAAPEVTVQVRGDVSRMVASPLEGEERNQTFERFKASAKRYADYESKTSRAIPVVALRPTEG